MCSACTSRPTIPVVNPTRDRQSYRGTAEILDVLHDTDIDAFPEGFPHRDGKRMVRSPASA